ncbi:MAG: hypothetical protein WCP01_01410 [Methylococcaceae bacterium]
MSNGVANPVTLELLKLNIKLHFARRTFHWSNEGKVVAAVHFIIMGFAVVETRLIASLRFADCSIMATIVRACRLKFKPNRLIRI